MLKNIDPLLTAELLSVLAAMGHGDELAVTDANFPADSVARGTCHGQVISVAGASLSQVVGAIVSVLPLDEFVDAPVRRMAIDVTPDELPEVQGEVQRSSTPSVANIGRWVSWSVSPSMRPPVAVTRWSSRGNAGSTAMC